MPAAALEPLGPLVPMHFTFYLCPSSDDGDKKNNSTSSPARKYAYLAFALLYGLHSLRHGGAQRIVVKVALGAALQAIRQRETKQQAPSSYSWRLQQ